jgi:hypothetical protein
MLAVVKNKPETGIEVMEYEGQTSTSMSGNLLSDG